MYTQVSPLLPLLPLLHESRTKPKKKSMLRRLMSVEKRPVCNKKKVSDDKFAKEMTQMISNDKLQNLQHKKRWAILQRILHRMSELPDGRLFKAHQYHCATTLHQLSIRLCPLSLSPDDAPTDILSEQPQYYSLP